MGGCSGTAGNETPRAVSETRNLFAYAKCYKKNIYGLPVPSGAYRRMPAEKGIMECVRWDFKLSDTASFILVIGWMMVGAHFGMWMVLQACIGLAKLWAS